MDEDISIINTNTRNEKIKNFFIHNKKKIISGLSFIVILIICYFAFGEYQDRKKIKISDSFHTITINYSESNKEKTAKDLIQIINEKKVRYFVKKSKIGLAVKDESKVLIEKNKFSICQNKYKKNVKRPKEITHRIKKNARHIRKIKSN